MRTCCLTLLIVFFLASPAVVDAQHLAVNSDRAARGPVFYYPNGIYSPYPGIWAPMPYPGWNYPPHWIYSYMFTDDAYRRRDGDTEERGRYYRGRDTLSPAVPYSDYLKTQKDLLKAREAAGKPAPTADKALLEIRLPHDKARLFFDGAEAAGEGDVRVFLTPPLKANASYSFKLKTTWPGFPDDRMNELDVSFRAGDHKIVDLRPK
jgi:uncharacterized protein (TIGR03000 family)